MPVAAIVRQAIIVMLALACTAAQRVDGPVKMTVVAHGAYAQDTSGRKAVLAKTDAEYRRLWSELIGEGEPPKADAPVVFLLAGQRNTGGWSVEPAGVTMENGTAVIEAHINAPLPRSIVTQALTSPYAVIMVHSPDVKSVRW